MTIKELRTRAEQAVRMTRREGGTQANQDVQRLVYELQVHQIELEMQNESLRHAQQDVEKSHDQYQELFDCAPAGYLMLDATGVVVRANAAALMLMGVSEPRLVGKHFASFLITEDASVFQDHFQTAQWDTWATIEVRLNVAGTTVDIRLDTSAVPSLAANCLMVMTDVSERKRSVEALERLNRELEARVAARTAELEARNHQLEAEIQARTRSEAQRQELEQRLREAERFESLGTLAAGIAHDFNNLLVSVLGTSDLLLVADAMPEEFRESLSQIKRAGRSASELTRQLLVFAGRGQPSTAAISLPHVIADSLETLRSRLSGRIQVRTHITGDEPLIEADRSQVHQVVMNLLGNATEAIGGSGEITVHTRSERLDLHRLAEFQHQYGAEPGDFTILRVQDSGPGVDSANLPRIFDPFFTTKFTGRGLGLATVLGIVQSHRGAVRVWNDPGGGACFEIAFPVAARRRETERPPMGQASAWTGSGAVLLIDDDDGVRKVVAQMLTSLGFDVSAATGGEAGLDLFCDSDNHFGLVVLDWLMPGVSGEQVFQVIRELDTTVPVILMSGYSLDNLGSYDARTLRLQKPMSLSQLRDAARAVTVATEVVSLKALRVRPLNEVDR